jgi:hypothetical protein
MRHLGFEVLTAAIVKSTVCFVGTLCSSETARCYERTHCLHHQGRKVYYARNQQKQTARRLRLLSPNYMALNPRRLYTLHI